MYKYLPLEFNLLLARMGCLRIGTLHDFRRSEHKRGVADPREGKKAVRHRINSLHIEDIDDRTLEHNTDFRALSAFRAFSIQNSKDITFKNIEVINEIHAPDYFIYCLSSECSRVKLQEFEGANSILQITNLTQFFSEVTRSLSALYPVRFRGLHTVTYKDRVEDWNGLDWGQNPAFIKELIFKPQAEIRALWEPIGTLPIHPIVLGSSILPKYCRLLYR